MSITCNIGRTERVGRLALGVAIAAAGVYYRSWWGLLALAPLYNALFGHCYLYRWLGLNTNRKIGEHKTSFKEIRHVSYPRNSMSSSVLNKSFKLALVVKGVDGALQMVGAALLYVLKPGTINHIVVLLTQRELSEDPRDRIALSLLSATQRLGDVKTFGAVYLCVHGLLKIILASSLLRGALWAYRVMIGYLLLFMSYQLYRFCTSHAFGWLFLTMFDACVAGLTWHGYREYKGLGNLGRKT